MARVRRRYRGAAAGDLRQLLSLHSVAVRPIAAASYHYGAAVRSEDAARCGAKAPSEASRPPGAPSRPLWRLPQHGTCIASTIASWVPLPTVPGLYGPIGRLFERVLSVARRKVCVVSSGESFLIMLDPLERSVAAGQAEGATGAIDRFSTCTLLLAPPVRYTNMPSSRRPAFARAHRAPHVRVHALRNVGYS